MSKAKFSTIGIFAGAIALLAAITHFWAGPFSKQSPVEEIVGEKVKRIREATIASLKGEEYRPDNVKHGFNFDRIIALSTSLLGGVAMILAVIGFGNKEPVRIAGGAVFLGGVAIAFQFAAAALGAIIVVILIAAVLSKIGIS